MFKHIPTRVPWPLAPTWFPQDLTLRLVTEKTCLHWQQSSMSSSFCQRTSFSACRICSNCIYNPNTLWFILQIVLLNLIRAKTINIFHLNCFNNNNLYPHRLTTENPVNCCKTLCDFLMQLSIWTWLSLMKAFWALMFN